tara:strand:+ start:4894 stop:5787 length:894 start_codon:yes stop_codon:yes gene_type:complete
MVKRRSLGRGLEALLSTETTPNALAPQDGLREVPIDLLERGRYQPRNDMKEESLADLAETIEARGLLQPIVIRPLEVENSQGEEQRYEIIAGERRWRAAQLAGLHTVPAMVRRLSDHEAVAIALIENIQREDLNPLEEALALQRLVDEFDMTHSEAANTVGRSRVSVSNLLRLLELPAPVKEILAQGDLGMGHARALLGLASSDGQIQLAQRIVREEWSVRQTERAVKRYQKAGSEKNLENMGSEKDPNVERLERDIGEKLGASVQIQHGTSGGRLTIRYHSLEELEGIVGHLTRSS